MCGHWCRGEAAEPPKWIKPQLTRVTDESPAGDDWLHEIKYDSYRTPVLSDGNMALAASPTWPLR